MQEVGLGAVCDEIAQAFGRGDLNRVHQLLLPALDQFPDIAQLWFYAGNLYFKTGAVALSMVCFEKSLALDANPLPLANLAAALRRMNRHEDGLAVGRRMIEFCPDYEPGLINLGCMFVNEGMPHEGIAHLEKALKLGRERGHVEQGAEWNLSLLYLEAGRFEEGFNLYRSGMREERQQRMYGYDVDVTIPQDDGTVKQEHRSAPEPEWLQPEHVGKGKTLIVYGEQGIGDELMAGTLLEEARREFDEVIFDCHPRLEQIHRAAHPGMRIYPTRKEGGIAWPIVDQVKADYKAPLFDLAARYRPTLQSFLNGYARDGSTYEAWSNYTFHNPERAEYRDFLSDLAQGKPIIALGTRGGAMNTARSYRTLRQTDIDRLFSETDAMFVSVDYDDMTELAAYVHEKYGAHRFIWNPSIAQHWDYHHTAALIAACDLTVTVCQSAFHMSAGMGHPTVCLVPKRCAWRYAKIDNLPHLSYWYPSPNVILARQGDDETWQKPLDLAIGEIKKVIQ